MTPQELKNSILQLAIQGKLVEQRPEEGTAEELYRQIQQEKQALIKAGKIKKDKRLENLFIESENVPFDIPESWKWVSLGSILNKLTDGTHKTPKYTNSGIKFVSVKDMSNGVLSLDNTKYISLTEHEELFSRCDPQHGDMLLSKIGTTGVPAIIDTDEPFSLFVSVALLKYSHHCIDERFLYYLLQSPLVQLQAKENTRGVGNKNWVLDAIAKTCVVLPPLIEQKRIVAKIEELLPLIDRYEKAWTRLEDFNKRFPADMQKSILQLAIQGKLTEQRPEEGTGEELYRQIQKEKQALIKAGKIKKEKPLPEIIDDEIPFDIPNSWKWIRLQDIILSISAGKSFRCNEVIPEDQEPGIVKVSAVTWGTFREEESKTCISLSDWNEEYRICEGNFLISRANTKKLVGACVIVERIRKRLMLSDKILRISFASDVDLQYLLYAMRSDVARAQIESSATGTSDSMKNISQNNIREIILPLPPLAEQKRIVTKLKELLPLYERLK